MKHPAPDRTADEHIATKNPRAKVVHRSLSEFIVNVPDQSTFFPCIAQNARVLKNHWKCLVTFHVTR